MPKIYFKKWLSHKHFLVIVSLLLAGSVSFFIVGYYLQKQLIEAYNKQDSIMVRDRTKKVISIELNERGYSSTNY